MSVSVVAMLCYMVLWGSFIKFVKELKESGTDNAIGQALDSIKDGVMIVTAAAGEKMTTEGCKPLDLIHANTAATHLYGV